MSAPYGLLDQQALALRDQRVRERVTLTDRLASLASVRAEVIAALAVTPPARLAGALTLDALGRGEARHARARRKRESLQCTLASTDEALVEVQRTILALDAEIGVLTARHQAYAARHAREVRETTKALEAREDDEP